MIGGLDSILCRDDTSKIVILIEWGTDHVIRFAVSSWSYEQDCDENGVFGLRTTYNHKFAFARRFSNATPRDCHILSASLIVINLPR